MVTVLQRLVLRTTKDSPVDRIRQASAFPPNYIHSIDSSHMMLTALACQRNGAPSCPPACWCTSGYRSHRQCLVSTPMFAPCPHVSSCARLQPSCLMLCVCAGCRVQCMAGVSGVPMRRMQQLTRLLYRAGLAFAGVHDSFWTHAGSVDDLNRLLREAFVELHSRPLLQELAAEMQARLLCSLAPDLNEHTANVPRPINGAFC